MSSNDIIIDEIAHYDSFSKNNPTMKSPILKGGKDLSECIVFVALNIYWDFKKIPTRFIFKLESFIFD